MRYYHHRGDLKKIVLVLITGMVVVIVIGTANIASSSHHSHRLRESHIRHKPALTTANQQTSNVHQYQIHHDHGQSVPVLLSASNSTNTNLALNAQDATAQVNDSFVVVFSVPPKCGSRTLLLVVTEGDHFREITTLVDFRIVERGSLLQKTNYINSAITRTNPPAFIYTHAFFIPYTSEDSAPAHRRGGDKTVVRISIIRDPLERKVSHYYYSRNRDLEPETQDEKVWRNSLKSINQESFDDCVRNRRLECVAERFQVRLITQFCGYGLGCKKKNRFSLERAKETVEKEYLLVGIMEEYEEFIILLSKMLPSLFGDSLGEYRNVLKSARESSMKTQHKLRPENTTVARMKKMMELDFEFYEFVKQRFYQQKMMYS